MSSPQRAKPSRTQRGVAALPLSKSYIGAAQKQGLLLGFGCAAPQRLIHATRILGEGVGELT